MATPCSDTLPPLKTQYRIYSTPISSPMVDRVNIHSVEEGRFRPIKRSRSRDTIHRPHIILKLYVVKPDDYKSFGEVSASESYQKNLRMTMERKDVRAIFSHERYKNKADHIWLLSSSCCFFWRIYWRYIRSV
jgi:hypothetical protein